MTIVWALASAGICLACVSYARRIEPKAAAVWALVPCLVALVSIVCIKNVFEIGWWRSYWLLSIALLAPVAVMAVVAVTALGDRGKRIVLCFFAIASFCLIPATTGFTARLAGRAFPDSPNLSFIAWLVVQIVFYAILPFTLYFLAGRPKSELSSLLRVRTNDLPLLALVTLAAVVAGALAAQLPEIHRYYPLFLEPNEHATLTYGLLIAELLYLANFVAYEFYYHGFLVQFFRPIVGFVAVGLMAASAGLIHVTKPMPEALLSVGSAMALGVLAWRLRSVVACICIHAGFALAVDVTSLATR